MTDENKNNAVKVMDAVYEKKANFGDFMKNYLIDIVVIAIMVVYVARNIATIGIADKSVWEFIADSALTFCFAVFISMMMQSKGLLVGEKDEEYLATMREYAKIIEDATPFLENMDAFCEARNERNLKREQTRILRAYGVTYETFIEGTETPTDKQVEAFMAAGAVKIHQLTTKELVSENDLAPESYELGLTKRQFARKRNVLNYTLTAATAIIFGYFALRLVQDFSWAALIWSCVQVVFFAVKGTIAFFNAYMFMKNEYRNRIIYKTAILYEFYNQQIFLKEERNNGRYGTLQTGMAEDQGRAGSGRCGDAVVQGYARTDEAGGVVQPTGATAEYGRVSAENAGEQHGTERFDHNAADTDRRTEDVAAAIPVGVEHGR